jgi:hypothetical protein
MSGIRTNAAAELLGVSPSTLRSWERRLGYPRPRRTPGNHRQYDLGELEALRDALHETGNISSAVEIAQRRGRGIASPARLLQAFDRFDEAAADREMEQSLAVRSVERSVEEVLLRGLEMAARRSNHEVELEHACRWATGWLHAARRLAPAASRPEGVLLLESGTGPSVESVHSQALELAMRRAGLHVLALSADLAESRFQSAIRALRPAAVVLCGAEARLDVVGTRLRNVLNEQDGSRLFGYRTARLVSGRRGAPVLGSSPFEATANLIAALEQPASAQPQRGHGAQHGRARASA